MSKASAPFLIVHGEKDPLVPWQQSELLEEALKKAGCEATLIKIAGAGHGGPQFVTPEQLTRLVEFFDRHLKKSGQ